MRGESESMEEGNEMKGRTKVKWVKGEVEGRGNWLLLLVARNERVEMTMKIERRGRRKAKWCKQDDMSLSRNECLRTLDRGVEKLQRKLSTEYWRWMERSQGESWNGKTKEMVVWWTFDDTGGDDVCDYFSNLCYGWRSQFCVILPANQSHRIETMNLSSAAPKKNVCKLNQRLKIWMIHPLLVFWSTAPLFETLFRTRTRYEKRSKDGNIVFSEHVLFDADSHSNLSLWILKILHNLISDVPQSSQFETEFYLYSPLWPSSMTCLMADFM